jgi:SnoaL-like domain
MEGASLMQTREPLTVVNDWVAAANAQDAERLVELSDPNIEIVGPRGSGFGQQLLRDWLARAGLELETLRTFVRGDTVVLEQRGVWLAPDTGAVTGEKVVASFFQAPDGRVARFARFDSLEEAFAATDLGLSDEQCQDDKR